jgi:hypothetical protein
MQQRVWILQDLLEQLPPLSDQAEFNWQLPSPNQSELFNIGDLVYFWRSQPEPVGIIASAIIMECSSRSTAEGTNLRLKILKYARHAKQIVKADWLDNDPVLQTLPILSRNAEMLFAVEDSSQMHRIADLWANTGRDWTAAESLAGLWAYHLTYGGIISKKDGSPIATVALKIGRAIGGVYNKVLNFRAIDPRDTRHGLSGGSVTDEAIWQEFYLPASQQLDIRRLQKAYQSHWEPAKLSPITTIQAKTESNFSHSTLLATIADELDNQPTFQIQTISDHRKKVLTAIAIRQGQQRFRSMLLALYDSCCMVTGCRVVDVLEAAHIIPYQGTDTNHPANGLLFRADIHTLFDLGYLSISPDYTVLLSDSLKAMEYEYLAGRPLVFPLNSLLRPSQEALEVHRNQVFRSN